MEYDSMILKTHHLIVRGLKNAFFIPFTPPLYRYPTMTMTAAVNSKEELGIQEVGWKWISFMCKICFWTHVLIISDKKKHPQEKADRER